MSKGILSILTLAVFFFSACAQQKKTATNDKKKNNAQDIGIVNITMGRTPCFGTCPAYTVSINADGTVKYTSMHYTEYEGTFEKSFPLEKVTALFKQFKQYKVDTCQEEYKMMIADMPGLNFTITYKDKGVKNIMNAHFGPEFLNMLAAETDSFSKVDASWKKTADTNKN